MLPPFLRSSYHRYKADTNRFTEWLIEAATSCGTKAEDLFKPDPKSSNKRSGKITKIPLKGYATLVDVIVKAGVTLPKTIRLVLKRAIAIRKKFAVAFQMGGHEVDDKADKGHLHFITVLESALERLSSSVTGAVREPTKQTPKAMKGEVSIGQQIPDLLEHLALDDNDNDDGLNIKDYGKDDTPKMTVQPQTFEIEDEYELELPESFFMAFCLLDDLNTLRDFIKETWTEYKDGMIDAMTAAVTTNSAVILGKEMIDDVFSKIDRTYFPDSQSISTTMYKLRCLLDNVPSDASRRRANEPFDLETLDTADWALATATILLQSFIPVLQPGHCPFYRKGHFGPVDTSKPYTKRSNEQKFQSDREAVLDILGEFVFLVRVKNVMWLKDEITETMMDMMVSKKVTLPHAFCIQIFLDVGNVLEPKKSAPFNDLRMTSLRAKKSLTSLLASIKTHPCASWPKSMTEQTQGILEFIETHLLKDVWIPLKEKSAPGFKHAEFHLFKENPVLSGLTMYDLNLNLQDIGLTTINTWKSVFPILHLYNLLEHAREVPTLDWKDLDLFLKFHDEKTIFVGGRPVGIEDSFKRFLLFWGMPATFVSKVVNGATKPENNSRLRQVVGTPRAIAPTTVLATAFHVALVEDRKASFSLAIVEKVLEYLDSVPDSTTSTPTNAFHILKRKWKSTKTLTPLQLLATLRSNLATEEPRLLFNYIGLHERCIEFYEKARAHLHDKFVQYNGPNYLKDIEKETPFVVFYIMHAALMSSKAQRTLFPKGPSSTASDLEFGSVMIRRSGEQIREFMKGGKGEIACKELRVFSKIYGKVSEGLEAKKKEEKDVYWTAIEDVVDPKALAMYQFGRLDGRI
ncbi:hypothetical protein TWF225_002757 [Orbilia oligospora]|nr:hypothetical protein TWF225_002757 [Orbilia oligospora]KAF3238004.1 hypothetical protein TWF217_001799 [Orbilia oligospora]KAF3253740.1 hypothetical protein TWF128_006363 [Orbilia oligospora]